MSETAAGDARSDGADDVTADDIRRWIDVWNTHDVDRIVDLFTDDVKMHQPQNPEPLDKDGLASFFSMLFQSYTDIHFDLIGHVIDGREAASWERVTGTMTGPFTDPGAKEVVEPTHKTFDLPAAMHLSYGDGHKIREVRIYWDRFSLMSQLGLLPS